MLLKQHFAYPPKWRRKPRKGLFILFVFRMIILMLVMMAVLYYIIIIIIVSDGHGNGNINTNNNIFNSNSYSFFMCTTGNVMKKLQLKEENWLKHTAS